ncbi:hypothetical protein [Microbacterium sp. SORGH_AS_0888]|uniref:hypothetical protein n=1 Tax=Microbacterium sp. SORGH_AS_0888 TaxID=3041791 RepID=UPI002781C6F8|nr:hypothetical protein [Microbacterium sp. SORGH_AS_0888]MDQ1128294.1 hypothetical protein [Microbacterium sp. SORGH_AS_0888]
MATKWHKRGADPVELKALYAGVPSWLERYLVAWVKAVSYKNDMGVWGNEAKPNPEYILEYETAVRRPVSMELTFVAGGAERLLRDMGEDEFLDFVDFLLFRVSEESSQRSGPLVRKLEEILLDAGSEWRVGKRAGFVSLEKRVPDGVALAAEQAIAASGDAGQLLAEAWHAAFGKSPDAEEAYEKAIKAVEEAGAHVVSPNNKKATLGTMIRDMKSQTDWKLPLGSAEADAPVRMAEALWQGQESRHGGNGYRKPTPQEAEAAVLLAVPLVQWFSSGVVARR